MANETPMTGLGIEPESKWPSVSATELLEKPINRLKPQSLLHQTVLDYLVKKINMSEREMAKFYSRWRINETKIQAYVDLEDWEQKLKQLHNDKGAPPKALSIIVPYAFATISTVVTYLLHTFAGRKPIFQVASYKKETMKNAQMMEIILQYQADHTRFIKHLYQFLLDTKIYGVGIFRTRWKREEAIRTVWKKTPQFGWLNMFLGNKSVRTRESRVVFEGTEVASLDPYMFFPDPRVPMSEVNKRGEFAFWRVFEGKHILKQEEAQGKIKWVEAAGTLPTNQNSMTFNESSRALRTGGTAHPGLDRAQENFGANFIQVDQGSVVIIPRELGLGESTRPEKWLFTILNKSQIVQAEKLDLDHDMHPVCVAEPNGLGYGFGQLGLADYVGPMQDTLSWFVNSHIANVRTALNNMLIIDPSMVEMQDLKNPEPGKLIRLKKAAYGRDIRTILQQLQITDVTQGHIRDFELFMKMSDTISSVSDNLRGLQDSGGRKTATEVRTSGESAASRLAADGKIISAQAMTDLTEQQSISTQQFMSEEFFISVTGLEGMMNPLHLQEFVEDGGVSIKPEMVAGDFHYPIHDGTLPLDRVAMLDVWKEIFLAIAQDQELRGQFSVPGIFEYLAELGGAKNLDRFKVDMKVLPPEGGPPQGAVPLPTPARGIVPNPGDRLARGP